MREDIIIGASTSFYRFGDSAVEKVEKLIDIFESLDMLPYIQMGPSPTMDFEALISKLNALKDEHGIEYSVHQSIWMPLPEFYLNLGSSDKETRQKTLESLERSINFARKIGAEKVSFHAGYAANKVMQIVEYEPLIVRDIIPYEEAYSNVEENLKRLLKHADKNVKLSIENLNYRPERRYLYSTPDDFLRLPPDIGVMFDTGHAHFSENSIGDPSYIEKLIKIVGGRITEIHAGDNDGTEDQHKLVGFGCVPFPEIFKLIAEKQELPPIIIEAAQSGHGYSDQDLKGCIKHLAKIVKEVEGGG